MPLDGTNFNETAYVLVEAQRLLLRDGWCQGSGRQGTSRCVIVALFDASSGDITRDEEIDAHLYEEPFLSAWRAVARNLGFDYAGQILAWNDLNCHVVEDVLAVLDDAAVSLP
jgi:hypothetical protein